MRTHTYIYREVWLSTHLAVEVATHGLLGPGLVVVVSPPLLLGVTHYVGHCLWTKREPYVNVWRWTLYQDCIIHELKICELNMEEIVLPWLQLTLLQYLVEQKVLEKCIKKNIFTIILNSSCSVWLMWLKPIHEKVMLTIDLIEHLLVKTELDL